ncbi:MAG: hypothetical protein JWQ55_1674 [Rhodopila sp.]|nr:hypothetical protein [Rhodopila sp.]
MQAQSRSPTAAAAAAPQPEVRHAVRDVLLRSQSFQQLPVATQQQVAHDMTRIADYLAKPEGIPANHLPTAAAQDYTSDVKAVNAIGKDQFKAGALREGVSQAKALIKAVNFTDFVSGLIQGVFHAIVTSSIEQMQAYAELVKSVAQTLNQFRDENVSQAQGDDHLMQQFPDIFQTGQSNDPFGGSSASSLQLRDGVDEDAALAKVNSSLGGNGPPLKSLDMTDADTRQQLNDAARTQLATSRQQLLATMVMMGINRIVVTDGKIQAKILYDFQARDTRRMQRSAMAQDYARDKDGNVQRIYNETDDVETKVDGGEDQTDADGSHDKRDGSWYAKGKYQYTQQPIVTAQSAASETNENALQSRVSLSGLVDVNFKSDYFPLEKMADSFQIGQIQNAATPGRGATAAGAKPAAAPAATTPAATTPAATPAPAPAAAR